MMMIMMMMMIIIIIIIIEVNSLRVLNDHFLAEPIRDTGIIYDIWY